MRVPKLAACSACDLWDASRCAWWVDVPVTVDERLDDDDLEGALGYEGDLTGRDPLWDPPLAGDAGADDLPEFCPEREDPLRDLVLALVSLSPRGLTARHLARAIPELWPDLSPTRQLLASILRGLEEFLHQSGDGRWHAVDPPDDAEELARTSAQKLMLDPDEINDRDQAVASGRIDLGVYVVHEEATDAATSLARAWGRSQAKELAIDRIENWLGERPSIEPPARARGLGIEFW